jgi:prenyltransferase beta subunit
LRLQTLQVSRLAPRLLSESAELVAEFVLSRLNQDGGFADRSGQSDLYYTPFGIECLLALDHEPPASRVSEYLAGFSDPFDLDLVHVASLSRAWAGLASASMDESMRRRIAERIESFRADEGGYHQSPEAKTGTVYGTFLAVHSLQDLDLPTPEPESIATIIDRHSTGDGGYANESNSGSATTPTTAAAVLLKHQLGIPIEEASSDWLLSRFGTEGGATAAPDAPIPDLLSTATALHALSAMNASIEPIKEKCLDFTDTLWTNSGSFYGHWAENPGDLDVEYTFYGLLALGHLSL